MIEEAPLTESEKDTEIARLRERGALLDSLLGEALRHKYIDESTCSPAWLAEAKAAVTDLDKFGYVWPGKGWPKDVYPGGLPRAHRKK